MDIGHIAESSTVRKDRCPIGNWLWGITVFAVAAALTLFLLSLVPRPGLRASVPLAFASVLYGVGYPTLLDVRVRNRLLSLLSGASPESGSAWCRD